LFLNSLPVLAWRPAGQGRASGLGETSEAARPAEPLTRRTIVRDRSLIRLHLACLEPLIFIPDKNRAWKSPLAKGAASRAGPQRQSQKERPRGHCGERGRCIADNTLRLINPLCPGVAAKARSQGTPDRRSRSSVDQCFSLQSGTSVIRRVRRPMYGSSVIQGATPKCLQNRLEDQM
jgi:hypothetical protein